MLVQALPIVHKHNWSLACEADELMHNKWPQNPSLCMFVRVSAYMRFTEAYK
jgi:hypothetical protein